MIGTVKKWVSARGFGFIALPAGGKDIFLHISELQRAGLGDPLEGDRLEFSVARDAQGRERAVDVREVG